jgi:hypothetical protein
MANELPAGILKHSLASWTRVAFQTLRLISILSLGILLLTALAAAEELKLYPVDEAAKDSEFLAFRDDLLAAIRRRDLEAVVAVARENIKLSFGGSYGRETFRDWLVADDPGLGSSYWAELERAIALGGVFEGPESFCTPYTFCLEIPGCDPCDPYETLIATSDRAPVYAAADRSAKVVAELSYSVVRALDHNHPWQRIALPGGGTGYVTAPEFRSPIDYRARFERRDGRWLMTLFIAGD